MSLFDAFQLVATRRRIWPNDGFCRHLLQLEKEKRKKKETSQLSEVQKIENELEHCTISDEDTGDAILSTKP
jgi:hypothetical protein